MAITWTPTAQDVADLIPRLVPDADGTETGTFTTTTNPTADAVLRLAGRVAAYVQTYTGPIPDAPAELAIVAKDTAALGTAARVALPLDAEQSKDLREQFTAALDRLRLMVQDAKDGAVGGGSADVAYSFPGIADDLDLVLGR
jgi:hypothetical protein